MARRSEVISLGIGVQSQCFVCRQTSVP